MTRRTASLKRFLEPSLALELAPLGRIERGALPFPVAPGALVVLWRPGLREGSVSVRPATAVGADDEGSYVLATYAGAVIATRRE
ncbi:MAG: hypothetical protein ACYDCK_05450 [Thermoplasmatota archaeon]